MSSEKEQATPLTGTRVFFAAWTVIGALVVLYATAVRPPWGDEVHTLFFIHEPAQFLARYTGDPHPFGYYLVAMLSYLVNDSWLWMRVAPPTLFAIVTAALVAYGAPRPNRLSPPLIAIVVPASLLGSQLFIYSGLDIRAYGSLTVLALGIALLLYTCLDARITQRTTLSMAVLLAVITSVHVWGGLLACAFGLIYVSLLWQQQRLSLPVLALFALAGALALGTYAYGPFALDGNELRSFSQLDVIKYVRQTAAGFSRNLVTLIAIAEVYLVSIPFFDRRVFLAFDLPAGLVLFAAGGVSLWIPIIAKYSMTPIISMLLAGMMLRFFLAARGSRRRLGTLGLIASGLVLATNLAAHVPDLLKEKYDWQKSSDFVAERLREEPDLLACPVFVVPTGQELYHSRYHLAGIVPPEQLVALAPETVPLCTCGRCLFLLNHYALPYRESLLEHADGVVIEQRWRRATVGVFGGSGALEL